MPLYLGLSLHGDAKLNIKLRELFTKQLEALSEFNSGPSSLIQQTLEAMNQIWAKNQKDSNGWKKVEDYHVTSFYIGKDEEKLSHELYQNHVDDVEVTVEIVALIIVPNKIITGICFPNYTVQNRCPHVTLMTNEWKPV